MKIEYTLSEGDYLEAQRAHGDWSTRLLPVFGGLLILAGIWTLAQDPKHLGNGLAAIFIGSALAFGLRLLRSYTYRQDKRLHDRFVATFSDEGIQSSASTGTSSQSWSAFTRYVETQRLFLLYQGPVCMSIYPKRCLAPEDADAFRDLIKQKLPGGNRMVRKGLGLRWWVFLVVVSVAFLLMLITIRNVLRQSGPSSKPAQTQSPN